MADQSTTLMQLRQRVAEFVAAREWQKYHDPKNLSMSIAIETAELMEHFQWVRNDELPELLADEARRAEIVAEIADITCFVLALANALDLDLSAAVEEKLVRNAAKYPVETFRGRYFKPNRSSDGSD